jgi:hypothetical protein
MKAPDRLKIRYLKQISPVIATTRTISSTLLGIIPSALTVGHLSRTAHVDPLLLVTTLPMMEVAVAVVEVGALSVHQLWNHERSRMYTQSPGSHQILRLDLSVYKFPQACLPAS